MTSLPSFSPPAAQKQRGVIFPLWKGGPHETSLSHIPLRLDTGLLLDGLLHFAFLFQRISAGPRILQHPDRPAAWLVRPFDRPAATLCGGQGGPPKGSLPGAVRRPADPGHAAVHRRSVPASCCWRPPFPSGPVPQPSRQPHPQRPRHRLPSPFGGAIPGSSPCWPGWFFSTPATIFS